MTTTLDPLDREIDALDREIDTLLRRRNAFALLGEFAGRVDALGLVPIVEIDLPSGYVRLDIATAGASVRPIAGERRGEAREARSGSSPAEEGESGREAAGEAAGDGESAEAEADAAAAPDQADEPPPEPARRTARARTPELPRETAAIEADLAFLRAIFRGEKIGKVAPEFGLDVEEAKGHFSALVRAKTLDGQAEAIARLEAELVRAQGDADLRPGTIRRDLDFLRAIAAGRDFGPVGRRFGFDTDEARAHHAALVPDGTDAARRAKIAELQKALDACTA